MWRTSLISRLAGCALIVLFTLTLAPTGESAAQDKLLDGPRTAGSAGERFDGYAFVRNGASADVRQIVDRVNSERRKIYQDSATREGTSVDAVGRIYARTIRNNAPPGTWFLRENGKLVQK